jgi:cell division protein FtsA
VRDLAKDSGLVVGLDVGTTKICAVVGQIDDDGAIDIIGIGVHPSKGLRKGVVVNIDSTVESIQKAVHEAELMSGVQIDSAFVGIAGGHIKGFNSRGVIAISGKGREVTQADADRVIDAAKAVALPVDREVIHVLPQEFIIDDQGGIKEPLGMSGVRLEAEVHIVTAAVTSAQNIIKCVNRAEIEVSDIVLEQLASAEATLLPDEKELGVVLLDIGGGTTGMAIFLRGSIWHSSVISLGGEHITNDIAIGLRTPSHEAEEIKKKYGCAMTSLVKGDETIEVPSVGGRKARVLSRQLLCEIVQPRVEEIFSLVNREIQKTGYEDAIAAGIVVTGGTSKMEGMAELAEQIFDLPVRMGVPKGVGGLVDVISSPQYATGVGLVLYGAAHRTQRRFRKASDRVIFNKVFSRMKEWFDSYF